MSTYNRHYFQPQHHQISGMDLLPLQLKLVWYRRLAVRERYLCQLWGDSFVMYQVWTSIRSQAQAQAQAQAKTCWARQYALSKWN